MPYDYSSAPPPRDFAELIPAGTIASVLMRIRPGGAGEDGMLKRSKEGDCEMLDCEFVLVDGPYARRKFWGNLVLEGTTAGHAQAAEISRGVLRGILESARNIRPDDLSDQARARRMADPEGLRQHHLHRPHRRRERQAEERRHRRELSRQEHHRRHHHAGQEGMAPGRAVAAVQRRQCRRGRVASPVRNACSGHHETVVGS